MLHIVLIFSIFYLIFFIFLKILAYIKNNYYLCPEFANLTLQIQYTNMKKVLLLAVMAIALMACGGPNGSGNPANIEGSLPGKFVLPSGKVICFSMGNLQYNAAQDVWRFAPRQYGVVGAGGYGNIAGADGSGNSDNALVSEDYDGWIDLFGHGTSGWPSGAEAYQPWTINDESKYYIPLDIRESDPLPENYDLTDDYANADWGVYNKISNGGNEAGIWRTLAREEWRWLTEDRPNAEDLIGKATIQGACGMVLMPDDWQQPEEIEWESGYGQDWDTNEYSYDEWKVLEDAGAVFLPCAGVRTSSGGDVDVEDINSGGFYWSSSSFLGGGFLCAYDLYFNSFIHEMYTYDMRCFGESVRLVREL